MLSSLATGSKFRSDQKSFKLHHFYPSRAMTTPLTLKKESSQPLRVRRRRMKFLHLVSQTIMGDLIRLTFSDNEQMLSLSLLLGGVISLLLLKESSVCGEDVLTPRRGNHSPMCTRLIPIADCGGLVMPPIPLTLTSTRLPVHLMAVISIYTAAMMGQISRAPFTSWTARHGSGVG